MKIAVIDLRYIKSDNTLGLPVGFLRIFNDSTKSIFDNYYDVFIKKFEKIILFDDGLNKEYIKDKLDKDNVFYETFSSDYVDIVYKFGENNDDVFLFTDFNYSFKDKDNFEQTIDNLIDNAFENGINLLTTSEITNNSHVFIKNTHLKFNVDDDERYDLYKNGYRNYINTFVIRYDCLWNNIIKFNSTLYEYYWVDKTKPNMKNIEKKKPFFDSFNKSILSKIRNLNSIVENFGLFFIDSIDSLVNYVKDIDPLDFEITDYGEEQYLVNTDMLKINLYKIRRNKSIEFDINSKTCLFVLRGKVYVNGDDSNIYYRDEYIERTDNNNLLVNAINTSKIIKIN